MLFFAKYLAAIALLTATSYGAGHIASRRMRDMTAAMKCALGLAVLALVFFFLGIAHGLNIISIAVIAVPCVVVAMIDRPSVDLRLATAFAVFALPAFVLSLTPPHAFDETLYHLPTVARFASTHALPFIPDVRMPVFPQADEVLRVPLFQMFGDTATHLLSLLAMLVTILLVAEEGVLAVALFAGAPIVVLLATTGYVEALLTTFVTAAFIALERWRRTHTAGWLIIAGIFAGSAASVKYLGLFFCAAFAIAVAGTARRWRDAAIFIVALLVVALPWYARIFFYTHNPLFPFLPSLFGHSAWELSIAQVHENPLRRLVRLPWDLVVSRSRVNAQPPWSPALLLSLPLAVVAAWRGDKRARMVLAIALAWIVVWLALPADSRYLTTLLPMLSIVAASALGPLVSRRLVVAMSLILLAIAPLYALYRLRADGFPPTTVPARETWLARYYPEWSGLTLLNSGARDGDGVWVCGAEQLKYHYRRGVMIGDENGVGRYDRFVGARSSSELAQRLDALHVRAVLIVHRKCAVPALTAPHFALRHDDGETAVYERTSR